MSSTDESRSFYDRLNNVTESAAEEVDRRHRQQLCVLVERELDKRFRAREDPEDIAQSALNSLYRGIKENRFRIDSAGELWALLAKIAHRKILNRAKYHNAQRRNPADEELADGDLAPSETPLPNEEVLAADLIEKTVAGLPPPEPEIFQLRLQGYTLQEIADKVDMTPTAVRARLNRLRDRLRKLLNNGDAP